MNAHYKPELWKEAAIGSEPCRVIWNVRILNRKDPVAALSSEAKLPVLPRQTARLELKLRAIACQFLWQRLGVHDVLWAREMSSQ